MVAPTQRDGAKLFLTEVNGAATSAPASRPILRNAFTTAVHAPASKEDASSSEGARPSEHASRFSLAAGVSGTPSANDGSMTGGGGGEVFRVIDSMSEKQQRSRNIRSMIQKAAQKTILVVRAKNAMQAAENVTVRFHRHQVTDTPRSVQLHHVCDKVLRHVRFASKKQQQQYYEIFAHTTSSATDGMGGMTTTINTYTDGSGGTEVDALLKDMFWYLTAHCFQRGKYVQLEQHFYERIADTFTSLFIRLQMQPRSRDSGFFDLLPDVVAQILFTALYDAFPKSRKSMLHGELRREILRICHCWILGFVPADLSCAHWLAVDQESPKRIAALADFPAMRNRMLRAERIERTKLEIKNRHGSSLGAAAASDDTATDDGNDLNGDPQSQAAAADDGKLPHLTSGAHWSGLGPPHTPSLVQTRDRCVYAMRNSPLVDAFLRRHQLATNATHLKVQLRLTSGSHLELKHQEALHATNLPRGRRRRVIDPKTYTDALQQIESFGDSVRQTYASERKHARDRDAAEKSQLLAAQRALEAQFGDLQQHGERLHEFSNLLVSKSRVDALMPAARERPLGLKPSPPSSAPGGFTPRPPRQVPATRQ